MEKTLEFVKKTINETTLLDSVKEAMISRINDCVCDYEEIEEDNALIFELDSCLELYKTLKSQSPYLNGHERDDVEPTIKNYFKTTLVGFPYNIMTEDYIIIYRK